MITAAVMVLVFEAMSSGSARTRAPPGRSGPGVSAGFGYDDPPVAVRELTPMVGDAETFGEWQGRCEPLDCFGDVGVVQYRYYSGVWCGAVFFSMGLELG